MTVTLLTGATSGIGRSLARRLADGGDALALLARRKQLLETLALEIGARGGRALALACDVTRRDEVMAAAAEAARRLGPIERLVANAGGGEPVFVDAFSADRIARQLELNVLGVANCIEAVLPGMLERGAGHLVATGSLAAVRGLPSGAGYSASKAALRNLMESLRVDLRARGIAVTLIEPGPVRLKPGSKKSRLLSVGLEDATRRMQRAILAQRPYCAFPRHVAVAAALSRLLLPAGLADALLAGRGRRPKPARNAVDQETPISARGARAPGRSRRNADPPSMR